ncbi:MAG: cell wall metabolism sensor histidine kinase WalK [Clostridium sulfidigenes]|uniref:histidine kinase n=1 Tax=Clostridium sulfidigenes TaxID=318464 RepID=A0A927W3K3_9CLOT|nr:cell wall metabolism sensor histidine kinase WalK [Clostridium sulfidigenes]
MKDNSQRTMKKRLMLSVFAALVFVLGFLTTVFYTIVTYESEESAKEQLNVYAYLISEQLHNIDQASFSNVVDKMKNLNIRITIINSNGTAQFDSLGNVEKLINYNNKDEVIMAKSKGEGTATRYSDREETYVIYYAVAIEDGIVVRVSTPVKATHKLNDTYIVWYGSAIIIMIFISLWIANKLSYIIVKPIRDLDVITSMITNGNLSRRIKITTNDELGKLALNFNHMADRLESSLHEVSEKQNRLSAILQSMESGVIAIDNSHNIIMINNYAKKIFNIKEDVVGNPVENICKEVNLKFIFSMRDRDIKEFKLSAPTIKFLRVRTADIIIHNHQHIGAVAVIQDISDLKKLENMRTEFVANVSHELKTPLTSIRGFAETLKEVDDDETKKKFLTIINEEAERLTTLISDILLLSQIEHKQEFKKEVFNVNKAIEDVFYLMKNTGEQKQVHVSIVGDEIPNILGDRDKFKQMLINLVDNAIKYSEAFDTVVITKIIYDTYFKVIVEDSGMGIAKEYIPRLFERFYRVDKARSRAKGGTGLGLAIVKHIIIGFNGSIDVESTLGVGTKFIITIPYHIEK